MNTFPQYRDKLNLHFSRKLVFQAHILFYTILLSLLYCFSLNNIILNFHLTYEIHYKIVMSIFERSETVFWKLWRFSPNFSRKTYFIDFLPTNDYFLQNAIFYSISAYSSRVFMHYQLLRHYFYLALLHDFIIHLKAYCKLLSMLRTYDNHLGLLYAND